MFEKWKPGTKKFLRKYHSSPFPNPNYTVTNYENSKVPRNTISQCLSGRHQSFPNSKRLPRFLTFHNLQSQQRWLESGGDWCFLRVHVGARKPRGNRKNKSHDQCVTFTSPSFYGLSTNSSSINLCTSFRLHTNTT